LGRVIPKHSHHTHAHTPTHTPTSAPGGKSRIELCDWWHPHLEPSLTELWLGKRKNSKLRNAISSQLSATGSMNIQKAHASIFGQLPSMYHASALFLSYANLSVHEAENQEA